MKRFYSLLISTLFAALFSANFAAAQLTTIVGQTASTPLTQPAVSTSQAGAVTNPSSNFVINVSPGPILCPGNDLQYVNQAQLTLPASSTNLVVWNCTNNSSPALYAKQAVTGLGSLGTSALNQPGTVNTYLAAIPNVEIALSLVVCNSTACGNGGNGTITDQRTLVYFPVVTDWTEFVPAVGACASTVSGNSSGTNGNTVVGASAIAVVQASTSSTGTNTHSYNCHIPLPTKITAGKGVLNVADVTWFYGVQGGTLGTQATGNFTTGSITMPAAAASETPSTVTPVTLGGTITLTPLVASFNVTATTAGAFYSEKLGYGTPFALNTDLYDPSFSVTLVLPATTAMTTQTPGFNVHYSFVPF